jgi:hypothetical protein
MKIAVAITSEPFQHSPQVRLAEQLVEALERHGEQSQLLKLPIDRSDADAFVQSLLALRLLHIRNVDRLVAMDFPACSIQHEDKCAWLLKDINGEELGLKRTYQSQLLECKRLVDSIPQDSKSGSIAAALNVPRLEIRIDDMDNEALAREKLDRVARFLATESGKNTAGAIDPT